jgi:hypothetical protein
VVVVVTAGVGIFVAGSPGSQRSAGIDDGRISDLRSIHAAINSYWTGNGKLPESLEELQRPDSFIRGITDPVTGVPYEYRMLVDNRYELCASFDTDSSRRREQVDRPFSEQFWNHGAGRQCFNLEPEGKAPIHLEGEQRPTPPIRTR